MVRFYLVIIFVFISFADQSFARPPFVRFQSQFSELETLLQRNSQSQLNEGNTSLVDRIRTFSRANSRFLKSDSGKSYLLKLNRWKRYYELKGKLDKCLYETEGRRNLKQRILAASLALEDHNFDCLGYQDSIGILEETSKEVSAAMEYKTMADFTRELVGRQRINAGINIADMMYRVSDDGLIWGSTKGISKNSIANKAAGIIGNSGSSQREREQVKRAVLKRLNRLEAKGVQRKSSDIVARDLKTEIEYLNGMLSHPQASKEDALTYNYKPYAQEHFRIASSGTGLLLHMRSMSHFRLGAVGKKIGPDDIIESNGQFSFPELGTNIRSRDIKSAIRDYYSLMVNQSVSLNSARSALAQEKREFEDGEMDFEELAEKREERLSRLFKQNPIAVAQVLIKNPKYVDLACRMIDIIEEQDQQNQETDEYIELGRMIAGGVLILGAGVAIATGFLAPTAAPLVATGVALMGGTYSAAEIAYSSYDAQAVQEESTQLFNSIISGNTDFTSIEEREELQKRLADDLFNLQLAVVGEALSGGAILAMRTVWAAKGFDYLGRLGGNAKNIISNATNRFRVLFETRRSKAALNRMRNSLVNQYGPIKGEEMFGKFLAHISMIDEDLAKKVVLRMNRSGPEDPSLKELLSKLDESSNACK